MNLVDVQIPTPTDTASERARAALAAAESRAIITAEDYEIAAGELQAIKAKAREIDEQRKTLVKPIDEARKTIQAFFAPPLDWLAKAEAVLKGKLVVYQNEQDRIRREEQRKADEAARRERERLAERAAKAAESGKLEKAEQLSTQAATVVAPVIQREPPKVAGIQTREVVRFEITDAALLPREYLVPDESRIRKVANALKTDANIPGVRVWLEKAIASR